MVPARIRSSSNALRRRGEMAGKTRGRTGYARIFRTRNLVLRAVMLRSIEPAEG